MPCFGIISGMKDKSRSLRAIILAGGSGERFWPLSTPERPKQFLKIFGGKSLIRQSVERLAGFAGNGDVFVVTSGALAATTRKELPEIPSENVVGEPMRRDTGAAVALGVAKAAAGAADDPVLAFFPADQLITRPAAFRAALRKAVARARAVDTIVTLGIRPDRPATGYGYVDPKSGQFFEKPSVVKARSYLKRGFLWNAGMFIARASVFRAAFETHAPELRAVFAACGGGRISPAGLKKLYLSLPRISFDYAVMEKLPRVEVVPVDCGWDDVGGYAAFDRHFPHDEQGNVRDGECRLVDAEGNICVSRGAAISLLGVKNLVVVATRDSVLVADKSRVGDMKMLFKAR